VQKTTTKKHANRDPIPQQGKKKISYLPQEKKKKKPEEIHSTK
jgi:hypothetical protein